MKKVAERPTTASNAPAAPQSGGDTDRSREILQGMAKEAGERVSCVRVFDDYYRCNWWSPGAPSGRGESVFEGLEVSTFRIRKSRFVKAVMRDGQLVVKDATPVGSNTAE